MFRCACIGISFLKKHKFSCATRRVMCFELALVPLHYSYQQICTKVRATDARFHINLKGLKGKYDGNVPTGNDRTLTYASRGIQQL